MSDQQPDTNQSAPWWDQTIMRVGSTFGVPTLLVGYFLLQGAGVIPNPVQDQLAELHDENVDLKKEMQELKGAVLQQGTAMQEIGRQMARDAERKQMWCVMKAKTDDEKKACFPTKE